MISDIVTLCLEPIYLIFEDILLNPLLTSKLGLAPLAVPVTGLCLFIAFRALLNPVNIGSMSILSYNARNDAKARDAYARVSSNNGVVNDGKL